jgi:chromosome segregation protein
MPPILKSLELHGYKTFANRTLFEFAEKVTVVVGPNGSGKSNIADSLRWVLGEQSYGLLRGKKTEDMIFSGSENRPRAGMASATIVFDNGNSWLPIEFSEVALTRRAYRDGENEYLLNGQRVRLKDINELLAKSGLAERTYTVIGQGLVDVALSLKAEERRRLLEEAAGIGLYRTRREDAIRRLDITRRNLERVQDIMAELQPRLQSLERQARRAQEYEQVKADLRTILSEWYGYQWYHSQQSLMESQNTVRSQELKLARAKQDQADLDEQLSKIRDFVQLERMNINTLHRQLAQLHSQEETLLRGLAVAEEKSYLIKEQFSNATSDLTGLEEEEMQLLDQSTLIIQETEQLNTELVESKTLLISARQELSKQQLERRVIEEEITSKRQEANVLIVKKEHFQARKIERQLQRDRLQKILEKSINEIEQTNISCLEVEIQLKDDQKKELDANNAYQHAEEIYKNHCKKIEKEEHTRKELLDQKSTEISEIARLKTQLDVLNQAEADYTGYAGGTRLLLHAMNQDHLLGIHGTINNLLEVPVDLEVAISVALGEYLDAVLLDADPDDALKVLDSGIGRSILLPLNSLKPFQEISESTVTISGVLGVASKLVKAPAKLRPAVDLLLGQVVVVRDRLVARQIVKLHPPGVKVITLKGEIFHASGPIQAGQKDEVNEQTVLTRARQVREFRKQLKHHSRKIEKFDRDYNEFNIKLNNLLEEGNLLDRSMQIAYQKWTNTALKTTKTRELFDQMKRQDNWKKDLINQTQIELAQCQEEIEVLDLDINRIEEILSNVNDLIREKNVKLEALPLDDLISQASHWDIVVAVTGRGLENARTRQTEWTIAFDKFKKEKFSLENKIVALQSTLNACESEKSSLNCSKVNLDQQIKSLSMTIEPAEILLEQYEKQEEDLQKQETYVRNALNTAEHLHAQTRINFARRQEELQALQRRIEDDLGLVAFDYSDQVSGPSPLPLEGFVKQLPKVQQLSAETEESVKRMRAQLRRMGAVNPEALLEYREVKQRVEFLIGQTTDLRLAEADVRQVIIELDRLMEQEFLKTFEAVSNEFKKIFTQLFNGGSARLILTTPDDINVTGIDIDARLPGHRTQGLSLLSGGERSLTATALVFALLKVSPTPFCVLDEVDAMLDEVNVGRFIEVLSELSKQIQFVIITHNRNTVEVANIIYGVTMGRDSVSQVLSLNLDEVAQVIE